MGFQRLSKFFSADIGIDLGTANCLVYVRGKGVVLTEPSVVAIMENTNAVLAVGSEAKNMLGKTPRNIKAVRPMKEGVIAVFDITEDMIRFFIQKALHSVFWYRRLLRPTVMIAVPYGITEVETRAVKDSAKRAGAGDVELIEEPMAAAVGVGLPVVDPVGSMIVDIGGGTTEVAVTSLGGIVLSSSLRSAGDEIDNAIVAYMKRKHNVLIGEMTAEMLKKNIGSVVPMADRGNMVIRGRNLLNGLPATLAVTSAEVREAMSEQVSRIIDCIRTTLENTPPELSSDIYDNGIMLAGGGALLSGLDLLIQQLTGIRTMIAKNPMDCVAMGIGKVIDSVGELNGIVNFRTR